MVLYMALRVEARALCMLDKHSNEPRPCLFQFPFFKVTFHFDSFKLSKKIGWRVVEETCDIHLRPPHACAHVCPCTHTHMKTWTHPHYMHLKTLLNNLKDSLMLFAQLTKLSSLQVCLALTSVRLSVCPHPHLCSYSACLSV